MSRSNWDWEMLVVMERGNRKKLAKTPRSKGRNSSRIQPPLRVPPLAPFGARRGGCIRRLREKQQQTLPTHDEWSGNRTQATLVRGEDSQLCTKSALLGIFLAGGGQGVTASRSLLCPTMVMAWPVLSATSLWFAVWELIISLPILKSAPQILS